MNHPDAAWYPDPHDGSRLRYWDGQEWTEHYAPRKAAEGKNDVRKKAVSKRTKIAGLLTVGLVVSLAGVYFLQAPCRDFDYVYGEENRMAGRLLGADEVQEKVFIDDVEKVPDTSLDFSPVSDPVRVYVTWRELTATESDVRKVSEDICDLGKVDVVQTAVGVGRLKYGCESGDFFDLNFTPDEILRVNSKFIEVLRPTGIAATPLLLEHSHGLAFQESPEAAWSKLEALPAEFDELFERSSFALIVDVEGAPPLIWDPVWRDARLQEWAMGVEADGLAVDGIASTLYYRDGVEPPSAENNFRPSADTPDTESLVEILPESRAEARLLSLSYADRLEAGWCG